jgi:putative transposase
MRKNFTPEQMLHTVRQAESGTPVAEVCRKIGITEQTFYKWKRRVAGMGIAELGPTAAVGRREQEVESAGC